MAARRPPVVVVVNPLSSLLAIARRDGTIPSDLGNPIVNGLTRSTLALVLVQDGLDKSNESARAGGARVVRSKQIELREDQAGALDGDNAVGVRAVGRNS
jgi:hypothetical protein